MPILNKAYISEFDKFLLKINATLAVTESKQIEIDKYDRIAHLRDNANDELLHQHITWENF